jgi:thiamine transport system substrate-binding protein
LALSLLVFGAVTGCRVTPQSTGTSLPAANAVITESSSGLQPDVPREQVTGEVTVLTHDSFSISEEALAAFETASGITVRFLEGGDTGTLVNKAVLAKGNPTADVLYGVDNTFLSRALDEGIFEPYESPELAAIPETYLMDRELRALPVDYGEVCPNFDTAWFADAGIAPPTSLEDLVDPRLRGLTVVQNPATSSPGLSFLLATIQRFGDPGYLDYWRDLKENDVRIVNDWETAYSTEFSRAGGTRPIVISYSLSPIYEVLFAETLPAEPPSLAVTGSESCFLQVEFVGILAGTENRAAAEAWVDFMLGPQFQADLPMQMFVLPVRREVPLPPEFVAAGRVVLGDAIDTVGEGSGLVSAVPPAEIAANRERWVAEWTEAVLR